MRRLVCLPVVTAVSLAACAPGSNEPDDEEAEADESPAALAVPNTPAGQAVSRIYQDALRERGQIDEVTAMRLASFLHSYGGQPSSVKPAMQTLATDPAAKMSSAARAVLSDALAGKRADDPGLDTPAYRVVLGSQKTFVSDDGIILKAAGTVAGDTGLFGHSRGYAQYNSGVLRFAHGSPMPFYGTAPGIATQGPHDALEQAAVVYGLDLGAYGFRYLAEELHYDAQAPYWAGLCHAWSFTALDNRVNALVDVEGPAGRRGLWIFGRWLSRADLGNWMMGATHTLADADATLVDPFVSADDIFKGIAQYVVTSGLGMRADVWNDIAEGRSEVWNQPFYSAEIEVSDLANDVQQRVVAFATADKSNWNPIPPDAKVRLVRIHALWGAEVNDAHEGQPSLGESKWNLYSVTKGDGTVIKSYLASQLPATVGALPEHESDALPDYFGVPRAALLDAAFEGKREPILDGAVNGPYLRFFAGTVLARGIPDATRAAFEKEISAVSVDVDKLKVRYPGIANAYSKEQWQKAYGSKLGDGEAFGAAWGDATADFIDHLKN